MLHGENLPKTTFDIYDLPAQFRLIYEYFEPGFYRLTNGGQALNWVRTQLREDGRVSSRKNFFAEIALADWRNALSVATDQERRELIKMASANRLKIKTERRNEPRGSNRFAEADRTFHGRARA
ncbi:protein of unknown function [Candidatus Filomicrobium marinum]|uniref:Uncharacterized protein n=1 Tax=Candidatus Filomicrobium marinum TaxID=1608628 RepID=A0A0D6JF62_9HYPH|nr:hypothetical protein [Candidatus Filomicrobium marinum]CFX24617.1 protein of unknown function [Candidatus Filomicrobium marinum]CPR19193.1 protein of unknown function [Candidatus Filomicrobium marinum]